MDPAPLLAEPQVSDDDLARLTGGLEPSFSTMCVDRC
jgi:hypothetical protein